MDNYSHDSVASLREKLYTRVQTQKDEQACIDLLAEHCPDAPRPFAFAAEVDPYVIDIPQPAWDRLDRFEGEMYTRERVQVELADGSTVAAETYVINHRFMGCLEEVEWEFGEFLRNGKEKFRNSYRGYQDLT